MYAYEVVSFVSKLLMPLVGPPRSTLSSSESQTYRELTAKLSKKTLVNFPKLAIYEADPRLSTVLKIISVFKIECYSGDVLIDSDRQFIDYIRGPVVELGTTKVAEMIRKHRQVVEQTIFVWGGLRTQMACGLSRAVGLPLRFVLPSGQDPNGHPFISPNVRHLLSQP